MTKIQMYYEKNPASVRPVITISVPETVFQKLFKVAAPYQGVAPAVLREKSSLRQEGGHLLRPTINPFRGEFPPHTHTCVPRMGQNQGFIIIQYFNPGHVLLRPTITLYKTSSGQWPYHSLSDNIQGGFPSTGSKRVNIWFDKYVRPCQFLSVGKRTILSNFTKLGPKSQMSRKLTEQAKGTAAATSWEGWMLRRCPSKIPTLNMPPW